MRAVQLADFGKSMDENLARLVDDRDALIVTRPGGEAVIVFPLSDWESHLETVGLLKDSADAEITRRALRNAREGRHSAHALVEP